MYPQFHPKMSRLQPLNHRLQTPRIYPQTTMEISLKEENNQMFYLKKKKKVSPLKIEILNFSLSFQLIGSIVHHPSGQKQQSFLLQDDIQRPSSLLGTQGERDPLFRPLTPTRGAQEEGGTFSIPSLPKEKWHLSSHKAWPTKDPFTDPQSPFKSPDFVNSRDNISKLYDMTTNSAHPIPPSRA